MSENSSELIDDSLPEGPILQALGLMQLTWARLDTIASAALSCTLDLDPIEFSTVVGRMDERSKIVSLAKIHQPRKDYARAKTLREIANELNKLKALRNAVTHGFYIGQTQTEKCYCYQLFGETLIDDKSDSAYRFVTVTPTQLTDHLSAVTRLTIQLFNLFEPEKLRRLLDMPARDPVWSPPKSSPQTS